MALTPLKGKKWQNYVDEQRFTPAETYVPLSEDDVAFVVKRAAEMKVRVHAAGAGHASSPLVPTDGWLIDTSKLAGAVTRLDASEHVISGTFVRALAGTTIQELNRALDGLGLAMKNLGSAACQAIYGAIATGTHGSGVSFGALCDLVRSVDLVDGSGKRWRVEPARGFTVPSRVPAGVELLTHDETFRSVVVGVGVVGLVTSIVLEVREAFDLEETRTLTTWRELFEASDTDDRIRAAAHFEIWINPYADKRRDNTALVTVREESRRPRNPRPDPRFLTDHVIQRLLIDTLDTLPAPALRIVTDLLLRGQATNGRPHVDASYAIFNLGDSVNEMPVVASEWFFPMSEWKLAVDELLKEAERLRARPAAVGGVPFGVRFIKASPHYLAMTHGDKDDVFCSAELPLFSSEHGRSAIEWHYDRIATRHHGRPHWGQLHRPRPHMLGARFPEIKAWREVRAKIDPDERFANFQSRADGLTSHRVPHPVIGNVDFFDAKVPREVLPVDEEGRQPVHVDRRRFVVEAPAAKFVEAFQEVMLQPGLLLAGRFEVIRREDLVGQPFSLGEHFQGRFAIDEQLLQDTLPHPAWWTRVLEKIGVNKLLQALEDTNLSNFGEVTELDLSPAAGEPYSIRYAYLTGTPFAGKSHFTVEALDARRCEYTEEITFQPLDEMKALAMKVLGLRLHNEVVFGQVEAAADRLGVHYEALDPDHRDAPNIR